MKSPNSVKIIIRLIICFIFVFILIIIKKNVNKDNTKSISSTNKLAMNDNISSKYTNSDSNITINGVNFENVDNLTPLADKKDIQNNISENKSNTKQSSMLSYNAFDIRRFKTYNCGYIFNETNGDVNNDIIISSSSSEVDEIWEDNMSGKEIISKNNMCDKDDIRNNPIMEDDIRTNLIMEDDIRTNPIMEDNIRTTLIMEDNIRTNPILEDNIRTNPILEDNISENNMCDKKYIIFLPNDTKSNINVNNNEIGEDSSDCLCDNDIILINDTMIRLVKENLIILISKNIINLVKENIIESIKRNIIKLIDETIFPSFEKNINNFISENVIIVTNEDKIILTTDKIIDQENEMILTIDKIIDQENEFIIVLRIENVVNSFNKHKNIKLKRNVITEINVSLNILITENISIRFSKYITNLENIKISNIASSDKHTLNNEKTCREYKEKDVCIRITNYEPNNKNIFKTKKELLLEKSFKFDNKIIHILQNYNKTGLRRLTC
ncbi:hypothetical protein TCON_0598 [Astathelohania contejeani]|uniref:Uncharacterized protein n=1 Tax=Astathelohania contejeani TaxID=164912 RepID=A0ABQ7I1F0_9MICR|nr:hypothetical protein TCON_0598 [Thelohania contejeani]